MIKNHLVQIEAFYFGAAGSTVDCRQSQRTKALNSIYTSKTQKGHKQNITTYLIEQKQRRTRPYTMSTYNTTKMNMISTNLGLLFNMSNYISITFMNPINNRLNSIYGECPSYKNNTIHNPREERAC